MSDIKDWRDGVESWLKERGIPSAPGMAVRELSGAVMKPSPQALEATLTILKAQSPITALWHELDFEGEGFSFRTQSGWETLVCSARLLEDATVGPADTDSDDLEDDDDEGEWLYQVEPEVAERAVSVLQPAHAEFLSRIGARHQSINRFELGTQFAREVADEHPEFAEDVKAFADTFEYGQWWGEKWNLRDLHRAYWMEHAEELADEVQASEKLPTSTKAVLEQVVWKYLRQIDPCVNKSTGHPAVAVLKERLKQQGK